MALELHLEEFKHSQELARSFDDDLDFCPSLTAKELSEIILASFIARKDSFDLHQNAGGFFQAQYADMSHAAPAPPSKAIAIIDPNSGAALQLPSNSNNTSPRTSNATATSAAAAAAAAAAATAAMAARINTPAVSMGMSSSSSSSRYAVTSAPATAPFGTTAGGVDSYFSFVPMQAPQQPQHHQQHQLFSPTFAGHAYPLFSPQLHHQQQAATAFGAPTPLRTPTARIPIVDPTSGHVVSVPETPSTSSVWHHQSFVSVR